MSPTSSKYFEKVEGTYWFRVVNPWVRPFVTLFDACHILWTGLARVLKFHIWIPHGKIVDPYFFFLSELSPFLQLCPFENIRMKSCQQDISKSIWVSDLLGRLIEDDEKITWLTFERILSFFSGIMALWKFRHFKLVSKISQKCFEP